MAEAKDYWLTDLIFICGGWGWGVASDGRTVCYDTEENMKRKLAEGNNNVTDTPRQ